MVYYKYILPQFNHFLLSSLNEETYGRRLYWVDRDARVFAVRWERVDFSTWVTDSHRVFSDWVQLKGGRMPQGQNFFVTAKSRFASLLQRAMKSGSLERIDSPDVRERRYVFRRIPLSERRESKRPSPPTERSRKEIEAVEALLHLKNNSFSLPFSEE